MRPDEFVPPPKISALRALICWIEQDAKTALAYLTDTPNNETRLLKAGVLAELRHFEQMEAVLAALQDASTDIQASALKLRAQVKFYQGHLTPALDCIEAANKLLPHIPSILEIQGALLFLHCIIASGAPSTATYITRPNRLVCITQRQ